MSCHLNLIPSTFFLVIFFPALSERLAEEKRFEIAKRKERLEAHLYMTLRILMEDNFIGHQGNDLYDSDKVIYQEVRVKKSETLKDVLAILSDQTKYPQEQLRLWPMTHRCVHLPTQFVCTM